MTRENAILCLKGIKNYGRDTFTEQSDWQESLDMAIKALEQEPCDDCVRRQAVLAIAGDSCLDLDSYEDTREFCDEINDLPPVNPQPKTGQWIAVTNGRGGHECSLCHEYASSYKDGDERLTKYCPSCGAKMVELQETETWNGIHGQIIAPKGTFERIFNDVDDDDDDDI